MQDIQQVQINNIQAATTASFTQVLAAEDLRKSYGPRLALKGLSFSLLAGHVLGFLGPNGAGKTTTIRILTTILEPDSGTFTVNGTSYKQPQKIRRLIGVLPESMGFPKQLTGIEYLNFFAQLYGRSKATARTSSEALLEELGMQHRAKSLIGTYSRGMRQRLGIARALVNDPAVIFLDEPTLGLDPHGQQELLALIRRIARDRDTGIVLCSHHLSDIEGVCDDVLILNQGQIVAQGRVNEVIGRAQQSLLQGNILRILVPPDSVDKAQDVLELLPQVVRVDPTSEEAGWLRVGISKSTDRSLSEDNYINNRILEALIHAQIPILNFGVEGSRLQDVFFQLTTEVKE